LVSSSADTVSASDIVSAFMPSATHISSASLHPSMKSRRVRRHLEETRVRLLSARAIAGYERRIGSSADIEVADMRLLDLLTAALDLADDGDLQMLVSYARTSLIVAITRSANR
jgi:hypothetical protein